MVARRIWNEGTANVLLRALQRNVPRILLAPALAWGGWRLQGQSLLALCALQSALQRMGSGVKSPFSGLWISLQQWVVLPKNVSFLIWLDINISPDCLDLKFRMTSLEAFSIDFARLCSKSTGCKHAGSTATTMERQTICRRRTLTTVEKI